MPLDVLRWGPLLAHAWKMPPTITSITLDATGGVSDLLQADGAWAAVINYPHGYWGFNRIFCIGVLIIVTHVKPPVHIQIRRWGARSGHHYWWGIRASQGTGWGSAWWDWGTTGLSLGCTGRHISLPLFGTTVDMALHPPLLKRATTVLA